MDAATTLLLVKLIDAALAITGTLSAAGINYQEVIDAQEAAKAAGEEFSASQFIDQAQSAVSLL